MSAEIRIVGAGGVDRHGVVGTACGRVDRAELDLLALRWRDVGRGVNPSFRRLDELARAVSIAAEAAGAEHLPDALRGSTAVMLVTQHGCLAADLRFAASLASGQQVEPALFPYTLPSTALAEVAIRHRLEGPLGCLSVGGGGVAAGIGEVTAMLESGAADAAVLCIGDAVPGPRARVAGIEPRVVMAALVLRRAPAASCGLALGAIRAADDPASAILAALRARIPGAAGAR